MFSCNISFDLLLTKPSSRFLKCNGGNWPMYSLLKLTLVQEYARIKEVLDNRALLRILPSSVHDIFCTFKEIIQFKQINLHPQADMYHPFYSKLSIVNLNEIQFLCKSMENRDPLHRNSARRKTIQFRTLKYNNFLLPEILNSASDKKLKKCFKKSLPGSKTVMLINSVLITTLIPLNVKI